MRSSPRQCFRLAVFAAVCAVAAGNSPGVAATQTDSDGGSKVQRAQPIIESEFADHDFQPDGNLDKPVWTNVRRVRFDEAAFTREPYPQAETVVASRWTARYLYLAFWCHYQTLNVFEGEDPTPERWGLWEKDVVEAFIAPDASRSSHYYEFEIAPTNQWVDLEIDLTRQPFNDVHWNSGFEHATYIDAARHIWTAELRIPVAALTQAGIHRGAEWRINFYRSDGPGTDSQRRAMSWGALPKHLPQNSFHQPASFGI